MIWKNLKKKMNRFPFAADKTVCNNKDFLKRSSTSRKFNVNRQSEHFFNKRVPSPRIASALYCNEREISPKRDITCKIVLLQQAFAKRLVNADRCALFMVDSKTEELYANLFDEGDEDGSGYKFRNGAEIRYVV